MPMAPLDYRPAFSDLRAVVFLSAFAVGVYAVVAYAAFPPGAAVHPDMRVVYAAQRAGISTHVFASAVALLLGPLQFMGGVRRRHPAAHRAAGRVYLVVGVGAGGLSGLYMAQLAYGGPVSTAGFSILALLWLWTGWRGFAAIRRGDVSAHRRWMVRNFALTLAAVSLRIYLPIGFALGLPFEVFYPAVAWASWAGNLLAAEWVIARTTPGPG